MLRENYFGHGLPTFFFFRYVFLFLTGVPVLATSQNFKENVKKKGVPS